MRHWNFKKCWIARRERQEERKEYKTGGNNITDSNTADKTRYISNCAKYKSTNHEAPPPPVTTWMLSPHFTGEEIKAERSNLPKVVRPGRPGTRIQTQPPASGARARPPSRSSPPLCPPNSALGHPGSHNNLLTGALGYHIVAMATMPRHKLDLLPVRS